MQVNLDHPIVIALNKVFDLFALTFYWLVCCVPIVTIGASTAALFASLMTVAEGEEGGITKRFFRSFKENFRIATLAWMIMVAAGLLLALNVYICWFRTGNSGGFWEFLRGISVFFGILYLCVSAYLYAGIGKFVVTLRQSFTNSLIWSIQRPVETIVLVVLSVVTVVGCLYFWYVFYFIAAIGLWLQVKLLNRVFKPYIPKDDI